MKWLSCPRSDDSEWLKADFFRPQDQEVLATQPQTPVAKHKLTRGTLVEAEGKYKGNQQSRGTANRDVLVTEHKQDN